MPQSVTLKVNASESYPHGLREGDKIELGRQSNSRPESCKILKIDRKVSWMTLTLETMIAGVSETFARRLPIDAEYTVQREEPTDEERAERTLARRQESILHKIEGAHKAYDIAVEKQIVDLHVGYGLSWSTTTHLAEASANWKLWRDVEAIADMLANDDDDPERKVGLDNAVKTVATQCFRKIMNMRANRSSGLLGPVLEQFEEAAAAQFIDKLGWQTPGISATLTFKEDIY